MRVDLTVSPTEDRARWGAGRSRFPTSTAGRGESPSGTSLVDTATGVASFPLTDDRGACPCTRDIGGTRPGTGPVEHLWAHHPAPPEAASTVDLRLGTLGRLEGVPVP